MFVFLRDVTKDFLGSQLVISHINRGKIFLSGTEIEVVILKKKNNL